MKPIRLAPHSEETLQLRWEGSTVHIHLGATEVATLRGMDELKRGWATTLPNGKRLEVRTLHPILLPELAVLVDGLHVDDSPSHPGKMLKACAQGILIGSAIYLMSMWSDGRPFDRVEDALTVLQAIGAALLLRRMYTGLVLVGLALLADLIFIDLALLLDPGWHLLVPMLGRALFLALFVRAFIALREVRRNYN